MSTSVHLQYIIMKLHEWQNQKSKKPGVQIRYELSTSGIQYIHVASQIANLSHHLKLGETLSKYLGVIVINKY